MRSRLSVLGGAAATALLALAFLAAPAGAKTKTKVFSNATAIPIPDATPGPNIQSGFAFSDVPVSKKGTIKDINVGVQVTHPNTAELDLYLFKGSKYIPLGLGDSGGSSNDNFGGGTGCTGGITVFDGAAPLKITDGINPFSGAFRPDTNALPLALYNGDQLKGTWRLLAIDFAPPPPLATGTINCFQLTAKYKTG